MNKNEDHIWADLFEGFFAKLHVGNGKIPMNIRKLKSNYAAEMSFLNQVAHRFSDKEVLCTEMAAFVLQNGSRYFTFSDYDPILPW